MTFDQFFHDATSNSPFPWQVALYNKFAAGEFPSSANIPTGLGKTSIVAIWLIALAQNPDRVPRRLVYVVNRRTVVDQTTTEVERLRKALAKPEHAEVRNALASLCALPLPTPDAPPLAVSTLRGQFADNGEWCADPSRPAVVVGTVDMIGSGLLFSRYTRGFKTRPLHAGFLGQDVLLVHDEAHLEPAFQTLLEAIVTIQHDAGDPRKLRVIELTATRRVANLDGAEKPFGLDENPNDKDTDNDIVNKRITATKRLSPVPVTKIEDGKDKANDGTVRDEILERALSKKDSNRAILVFVRSVEAAVKITGELSKKKCAVATLTGTMRGKERDELVSKNCVFQRFLPEKDLADGVTPATGTVFLIATSAGEVGVNISADDLICDLSTYESMAQRFGRVNRFGSRDDSEIVVIYRENMQANYDEGLEKANSAKKDPDKKVAAYQRKNQAVLRVIKTLDLLKKLGGNASPAALDALPAAERAAAFSPTPELRVATEIQFDAWALTSIREPIAARPLVAPYLHGEAEWQPPETHVAWRKELDVLNTAELRDAYSPAALLEDFPLKPHELLCDTSERIYDRLISILRKRQTNGDILPEAWLVRENGDTEVFALARLISDHGDTGDEEEEDEEEGGSADDEKKAEKARKNLAIAALTDATLILPESLGGIENGMLTSSAAGENADVADIDGQRCRVWSDTPDVPANLSAAGFRLTRLIDTRLAEEADASDGCANRYWFWLEAKSTGARTNGSAAETLAAHTNAVAANTAAIAAKFFPDTSAFTAGETDLRRCIVVAARLHDLGKNRAQWQRNLGNLAYDPASSETIFAKSAPGMRPRNVAEHYRHEFGSLNDAGSEAELAGFNDAERDIVLHIVAAHHGRARPHFPANEIFDYAATSATPAIAAETPRRFARLQRLFGRWGLAWMESLLRAADYAASAGIVANGGLVDSASNQGTRDAGLKTPAKDAVQKVAPTATIVVNPANPGHYFACCGILELASRLSPEALAWFEQDTTTGQWRFHLANTRPLADVLERITAAEIQVLDKTDNHSAVEITSPFDVRLDWWRYENRTTGKLKTWAGQMKASSILATLSNEVNTAIPLQDGQNLFAMEAAPTDAVSYFDAPRSANAAARDVGFSMDRLKKGGVVFHNVLHPSVEFFCFIGLQRTRPALLQYEPRAEQTYAYHLWLSPVSVALLPVAAIGNLPDCDSAQYHFANPSRTQDYRAFVTARIATTR